MRLSFSAQPEKGKEKEGKREGELPPLWGPDRPGHRQPSTQSSGYASLSIIIHIP